MIIPKKLDDRVIHENDGLFPSNLPSGVTKDKFMNHLSDLFLENCNQKTLSKKWKK